MKIVRLIAVLLAVEAIPAGYSQGFVNLDFEAARIVPDPDSPYYPSDVFATDAVPGWVAYLHGVPQQDIVYNTVPLSAAAVTLQGPGSSLSPIQGQYFVSLWGEYRPTGGPGASAAIGQTGQIPISARALLVWGTLPVQVTFNGQGLGFQQTGAGPNYSIFSADISAYAGQTGELRFTAPFNQGGIIDNIQFSSQPIPEPGSLALLGAGGLALLWRFRRKGP